MKIILVKDKIFADLGKGYLLYLCTHEEYKKLGIYEVRDLIEARIMEKKPIASREFLEWLERLGGGR